MSRPRRISLLFLAALLAACTRVPDYAAFVSLPTDGWDKAVPAVFTVDTLPPGRYALRVAVRSSEAHSYPYRELALLLHQEWGTDSLSRDTLIRLTLFDRKGDPAGRGLSLHEHEAAAGYVALSDSAAGRIVVAHHMRDLSKVQGIAALGLVLTREE
ncbi:MAG: hypothetical protein J6M53_06775 [Bacteroidaceae bacterium]|nr:hypothetical protein [Bacteroidaceae bacterium]